MQIDFSKTNRLIEWLKKMIYLDTTVTSAQKRIVFRGQVYFCELGEGVGSEETKERPCIIIQNNLGNKNSGNIIVIYPYVFLIININILIKRELNFI